MKTNPTKAVDELITAISYAMDIEANKNIYHAWRTSIVSGQIAKGIVNREKLKDIFYASLLHDVGGVEFSHHIIHYLKRHDKTSRNLLLSHPIISAQLISNIPKMSSPAKLILDHHEWINGTGYPRAKTQKNIPFGAQIIRLADSIDIILHTDHSLKLNRLKNKMSPNIDKEYTKTLFKRVFDVLKKNGFFYKVIARRNTPVLFKQVKNFVGPMHMPIRIDAIGKTLDAIAQIIDMKHPYTSGHSLRVSRYAMACSLAMNLGHDEITRIKWAGLIHDIGKLGISRRILDKPMALTQREFQEVKKHASLTHKIMLKMIPSLKEIMPIASSHHEYFDGSGYPQGLKGKQIPQGARILALCDAFDAMTSNRPYRSPFKPHAACQEIKKRTGTQFDPEIVRHALPIFRHLGL